MNTTTYFQLKKMSPQFVVADIDRSIGFYTKRLGFDIDFRYEDFYVGIVKNGCSIHLKLGRPVVEERMHKRTDGDIDIVFTIVGIEGLYKEFSNTLEGFIQPLRNMPYGKEFYIADPDGYIIAFVQEA